MSDSVTGSKTFGVGTRQSKAAVSSSDISVYKSSAEYSTRSKGSKISSIYKSSEEFYVYSCDPCSSAGDQLEAEGFCNDCDEYLCQTCFTSHSRGKATRNHELLNKDSMPRRARKFCDPCKTAGENKDFVGYCDDCEECLCDKCFRSHSRSKATKHHNLIDKDNMPEEAKRAVASSASSIDFEDHHGQAKCSEEYTYIRKINIKASGDKHDCLVAAMTLVSNTEIVLADYDNSALKLVDTERSIIKGTLDLESAPFGLATISTYQIAVVLSNIYQIQIIDVGRTLTKHRSIKVIGHCRDIEYRNRKFFVSFMEPVQFQILQPSGAVYKTITPDSEVVKHCTGVDNIAVSHDGTVIYVSDWQTSKVLSIDMNGNMKHLYQDKLDIPLDILISPFGSVYLCSCDTHVVYKMRSDLSEATVMLGPGDDLESPSAVCFNADKQHLYVSNRGAGNVSNFIKVFKLR